MQKGAKTMRTATYSARVIEDARHWIEDVVSNPEDVEDANAEDVLAFVAKHYGGGLPAFVRDGMYEGS